MASSTGIIGPARALKKISEALGEKSSVWPQLQVAALTYTDNPPNVGDWPEYSSWQEMLSRHSLNVVLNLCADKDIIMELRSGLPAEVHLMEETPAQWLHALFRTHKVLLQKQATKSRLLQQTLDALPFPAIMFSPKGLVQHWNTHCARLTNVPAEKVLRKYKVGQSFYREERPLLGQIILEENDPQQITAMFDSPDVEVTPMENGVQVFGYVQLRGRLPGYYFITAQRIVKEDRILGSLELIQDMSAVSMLKTQLKEHQETLRLMMTNLPFPLLSTDLQGKIRFSNSAAQKNFMQKLRPESGEDTTNILTYLGQALSQEDIQNLGQWLEDTAIESNPSRTLSLDIKDSLWEITCIKSGENESENALWVLRNISEEENEERLSTALAFSGALSHELAQPLTAISNSARLLARTESRDQERIQKHKDILEKESERVMQVYRKLQNLTSYKLQGYLDTQIMDLDHSSEELFPFKDSGENE